MPTRRISYAIQTGEQTLSGSIDVTAGMAQSLDEIIAGSATGAAIGLTIDVSALKSLFVVCDRDATITFSGPDTAIGLTAGVPFVWTLGGGYSNPFGSTDVTGVLVDNGSENDARLQIELQVDPTP